jgi:tetratricopeptide (TPR) repeat protein
LQLSGARSGVPEPELHKDEVRLRSEEQRQFLTKVAGKIALLAATCLLVYPLTLQAFRGFYSQVYVYRANEFINTRLYYESEAAALKALTLNPQESYARYFLGAFYRKQGRLDDAYREISASLRTIQHPATPLRMLGEIMFAQKRYAEAAKFFSRTLEINPDPIIEPQVYWYLFGKSAYELKDFATAIGALQQAEQFGSRESDLFVLEARSYASLGIYSRALFFYRLYLAQKPEDAVAAVQMAEAYRLSGNRAAALRILEGLDARETLSVDGYQLLAALLVEKNDLSAAAAVLERAKRRFPNAPAIYFLLGEIHARTGNKQLMRENYEQYLRLVPKSPQRARIEQLLKATP